MNKYISKFNTDVTSVKSLMDFDTTLLETTLVQLTTLEKSISGRHTYTENQLQKTIGAIQNIKNNESLKNKYQQIYNSCLVLLITFFSSILKDVFSNELQRCIESDSETEKLQGKNFDFKIEELKRYDFNLKDNIGLIITESLNISFQDMQSTGRAFKDFIAIDIPRSRNQNNIIAGQAARHIIVHSDGKINNQFLNQVRDISERDFLPGLKAGDIVTLSKENIEFLIGEMEAFLIDLCKIIQTKGKKS